MVKSTEDFFQPSKLKIVLLPGLDGTGKLFAPFLKIAPAGIELLPIKLVQKPISYKEQAEIMNEIRKLQKRLTNLWLHV